MLLCDLCGGQLALLGVLGNRVHTRCGACGMDFSQEIPKAQLDVYGDDYEDDEL